MLLLSLGVFYCICVSAANAHVVVLLFSFIVFFELPKIETDLFSLRNSALYGAVTGPMNYNVGIASNQY